MKYPFLLYIMQYLKFRVIKKQTPPSASPSRLSFTPCQPVLMLLSPQAAFNLFFIKHNKNILK